MQYKLYRAGFFDGMAIACQVFWKHSSNSDVGEPARVSVISRIKVCPAFAFTDLHPTFSERNEHSSNYSPHSMIQNKVLFCATSSFKEEKETGVET